MTSKIIAGLLMGTSAAKSVQNDFDPAEVAAIRKQNAWCEF